MKIYLLGEELDGHTDLYSLPADDQEYLCELLEEIYRELSFFWLDNAYNLSLHNRPRLRLLLRTSPFVA